VSGRIGLGSIDAASCSLVTQPIQTQRGTACSTHGTGCVEYSRTLLLTRTRPTRGSGIGNVLHVAHGATGNHTMATTIDQTHRIEP
jgi:hypothetical protein